VPETAMNLGYLPDSHMPSFVNSLDLLAITNRDSKFGQYSHPIKIYEAMACHIPVVATQTRATEWILRDHPNLLVNPGNTDDFAKALNENLYLDRVQYADLKDWKELASQLDDLLQV
jgi:glycosyltransferase involved in cell wall biosynthesis